MLCKLSCWHSYLKSMGGKQQPPPPALTTVNWQAMDMMAAPSTDLPIPASKVLKDCSILYLSCFLPFSLCQAQKN